MIHHPEEQQLDEAESDAAPVSGERKVSGAELEARYAAWSEARAHRRAEQRDTSRGKWGLIAWAGALVLLGTGAVILTQIQEQAANTAQQKLNAAIVQQDAEEAEVPVDAGQLAERVAAATAAAAQDAQQVAKLQQQFQQFAVESVNTGPGNGAPGAAAREAVEHRRELAPFFAESSWRADEAEAYTWQTVAPFDTVTEIDPRFAWYLRYHDMQPVPADQYGWKVISVTPELTGQDAAGFSGRVRVVWMNADARTGEVYAWAHAQYSLAEGDGPEPGKFTNLTLAVTAAGHDGQYRQGTIPRAAAIPDLEELNAQHPRTKETR